MSVKTILQAKGRDVATAGAADSVASAIATLAERRIGALVIVKDSGGIAGILSERDIIRALGKDGAGALKQPVSTYMTAKVKTCTESNTVNDVMAIMTAGRFRHLPVVHDGKLAGIVSIGDVVKKRIHDVEHEAEAIRAYIASA